MRYFQLNSNTQEQNTHILQQLWEYKGGPTVIGVFQTTMQIVIIFTAQQLCVFERAAHVNAHIYPS